MTIHETIDDAGVLELVMDNPKVNALNIADTYELTRTLDGVKHRPEVKAVIITAIGKGFSAFTFGLSMTSSSTPASSMVS